MGAIDGPVNGPGTLQISKILDTDIIYVDSPSLDADCWILGADLKRDLGTKQEITIICSPDNIEPLNLGSITVFNYITIDIFMTRGDSRARKQQIQIFQISGLINMVPGNFATIPDDDDTIGVDLLPINESGNILLNIKVDDSDSNNVLFKYTVLNNG